MASARVGVKLHCGAFRLEQGFDPAGVLEAGAGCVIGGAVMDLGGAQAAGSSEPIEHGGEQGDQHAGAMAQAEAEMASEGIAEQGEMGRRSAGPVESFIDGSGEGGFPERALQGDHLEGFEAGVGAGEGQVVGDDHGVAECR